MTKRPMIAKLKQRQTGRFYQILACFFLFSSIETSAKAAISVGLSGSGSQNNAGLEKYRTSSGTVSFSLGIGQHVRVGANHRRAFEHRKGIKANDGSYYKFKSDLESSIYSLNLTLVLYNGLISPYIFGGIANKYYTNKFTYDFDQPIIHTSKFKLSQVPTYGFGIAIFLNRKFTLKIAQTYSPGKVITINESNEEEEEQALDSYTQVGISYSLM